MESRRLLDAHQLIGLCCLLCLGCGSPSTSPTAATPSNDTSVAAEASKASSSQPQVPSARKKSTDAAQTNQSKSPDASTASVTQVPSQPDEPTIATPTAEQLARWKHASFDPLRLLAFHENDLSGQVSFVAATNDGKHYLLGGTKLTLWDLESDEQVHEFITANTNEDERLIGFAVSPVGDWCAAMNASGQLHRFDIQARKETSSKETKAKNPTCIAISPDGKEIAIITRVGEVTILNADTLEQKSSFKVDARDATGLQYIAPSVLILASDAISSWDTSSGKKIKTYSAEKLQPATALSSNGKELVFGTNESLQRWNLTEDRAIGEYRGVPTQNSVIRFTSDGLLIAVATGSDIRIIDAVTGQILQLIDASGSTICDVSWIPKTYLLVVGTDEGRTRIWGRPVEGKALGLSPLHAPIVVANADSNVPATVAENLEVVDVRLLPKLPDAKAQPDDFNSVTYSAPVGVEEITTFYRHSLGERGWQEASDLTTPSTIYFQKNGFLLAISPFNEQPTETSVSISMASNYDVRQTPKLDEFLTETAHSSHSTISYKVSASLLQIETELLKRLPSVGWTSIVRLINRQDEPTDGRQLEFIKNGTILRVWVQRDNENAALFVVTYAVSLSKQALPIPPDAGLMEWDDNREAQMVATTSLNLQEATAFYADAMKRQGWVPREKGRRIDEDVVDLPFYWGQRDVTIALEPIGDGLVRIRAGRYSDYSWQKPELEVAGDSATDIKTAPEEGLQAADLPILHAVGAPTYETERGGNIRIELEQVSLLELSKEYEAVMKTMGWSASPFGDPTEDSVNIHFEKGAKTIYYESSTDPRGTKLLHVSGNGLLWSKNIASKELISYSNWLRNNQFPATLKRLGEFQTQMEKLLMSPKPD